MTLDHNGGALRGRLAEAELQQLGRAELEGELLSARRAKVVRADQVRHADVRVAADRGAAEVLAVRVAPAGLVEPGDRLNLAP